MSDIEIFGVGGWIRDLLLSQEKGSNVGKSKDYDYVVPVDYETMLNYLRSKGCQIIYEKPEFLTCKVKFPGSTNVVDFTCCRSESDYDGRRPGKTSLATIEEDLARRDFTVNAIARRVDSNFQLTGDYIDPFFGRLDIKSKTLRFVGSPRERLEEDGLRWLRALRFIITKNLTPDAETYFILKNIENPIGLNISIERIRDELEKCFKFDTLKTIEVLNEYPAYWNKKEIWLLPTTKEKRSQQIP